MLGGPGGSELPLVEAPEAPDRRASRRSRADQLKRSVGLVDVDPARLDVQLRPRLDVRLVLHVQVEGGTDVDLAGLLGLDLEIFALEDDLLLGVDFNVPLAALDEELLVLHVEGEGAFAALVG